MVYLNNINKSGTFLKNKNSFSGDDRIGLVEGFASFFGLIGGMIFFVGLCKIIKHAMWGRDSDNPPEEVPLRQGIMNGAIPNSRDGDIEIPLVAGNAEGNAEDWV